MDSKRLRTLKALTEHLRTEVTPANGYEHDLSGEGAVMRGRLYHDEDAPLPGVSILDNIDPDRAPRRTGWQDMAEADTSYEGWTLLVQGWVKDDKLNPTDPAFNLMADVRKALAKVLQDADAHAGRPTAHPNYLLGGLIEGMTMEPGIARPPMEGVSSRAFFWMRVTLKFVEDQNDPYAD